MVAGFCIAGRDILPESGFSENVRFLSLPDGCGRASGKPAILEGELPGEDPGNAHARTGCPGVAASSHSALVAGQGCWPPRRLRSWSQDQDRKLASANAALAVLTGRSNHPAAERWRKGDAGIHV